MHYHANGYMTWFVTRLDDNNLHEYLTIKICWKTNLMRSLIFLILMKICLLCNGCIFSYSIWKISNSFSNDILNNKGKFLSVKLTTE